MQILALLGGEPIISKKAQRNNTIGQEEIDAVLDVLRSGVLSKFLGCWDGDFYGGPKIQALERAWENYFNIKYAIAINSATSGLIAALGAIGIEPGDEVIVSPWTMCASATSILMWNAIPVFADIESETFNLDPQSVRQNITEYTKAIVVSDILGHPAQLDEIMQIAKEYNLKVIEDAAQAPGAFYKNQYAGTVADIGVFSLNYHKHIHTGEGGICVTNDANLAERMQLIRNHAEAVVGGKEVSDLSNMIGFNFRMTEIEAAIGITQLKKLAALANVKQKIAMQLDDGLRGLIGLRCPITREGCSHVFYVYPLLLDSKLLSISRRTIVKALIAEGITGLAQGYCNLHRLPLYQKKIAYGKSGFPWKSPFYKGNVSYRKGICSVAEDYYDNKYFGIEICLYQYTKHDVDLIVQAFHKVWNHLD